MTIVCSTSFKFIIFLKLRFQKPCKVIKVVLFFIWLIVIHLLFCLFCICWMNFRLIVIRLIIRIFIITEKRRLIFGHKKAFPIDEIFFLVWRNYNLRGLFKNRLNNLRLIKKCWLITSLIKTLSITKISFFIDITCNYKLLSRFSFVFSKRNALSCTKKIILMVLLLLICAILIKVFIANHVDF